MEKAGITGKDPRDARDSRVKILMAARKVFAKKGYDGATVKDLADESGLNVSLVSYYFGGKQGLYKACFEEIGRHRLAAAERILQTPASLEEFRVRLKLFVEDFIAFHLSEPDVCKIIHRECLSEMPITREIFKNTFLKATEKLQDYFRAAHKSGILKKEIDPDILNYLFFGALVSVVRWEPLAKDFFGKTLENKNFRERLVQHAIEHLVGGFVR